MASPTKINFKIYQGSTFRETLRWESSEKVYVPITNITKTAPMVVNASNHGLPQGWRVKISGCLGMKEANTTDYITTSSVTTDTIVFNSVNALGFATYLGSGVLEYNQPVNLSGLTARMQIRAKIDDNTVIKELTTANGGIIIDNALKTIQIYISPSDTATFSFQSAVYSLELVTTSGEVTQLINGTLTLIKEVTR